MIKLDKSHPPEWLVQNQATATATYIAAPNDSKPSPWRAVSVVESLHAEGMKKCMYCEGKVDDVAYMAVEHIRPKESFPQLVLDWNNLGLACTRCNTNKGAYWTDDPSLQMLNPYVDDVENHVTFAGPLAISTPTSTRGENTLRKLKFSERDDLVMSRMRRIEELDGRLKRWHLETDTDKRQLFAEDIMAALQRDREFSAALTVFARLRGFPI